MHSSRRVRGGRFCTRVAESVTVGHVVSEPLGSPVGLDDVRDPIHRVKTGRVCEGMPRSKRSGVRPIGRSRTFGSGHAEETCRSRIFHSDQSEKTCRSRIFPSGRGEETCRSRNFPTLSRRIGDGLLRRLQAARFPGRIGRRPRPDSPSQNWSGVRGNAPVKTLGCAADRPMEDLWLGPR